MKLSNYFFRKKPSRKPELEQNPEPMSPPKPKPNPKPELNPKPKPSPQPNPHIPDPRCPAGEGEPGRNKFAPTISKEEVAALPAVAFEGEIIVVDTPQKLEKACEYLATQCFIGFDTESRASFQKGVVNKISLLQLSTESRAYLFRLNKVRLDKSILKILESNKITKIGLSVAGDIRELSTLHRLRPKGFVDLQKIAPECGIGELSLLKLAAITLGRRISKAQRLSNWEAAQLTDAQKVYAATDAWVCLEIYKKLTTRHP